MQSLFKYYWLFFHALLYLHSIQGKEISTVSYQDKILPLLKTNCVKCHGADKQKGDIRLDTLSTDFLNDRRAAEIWHDAIGSNQVR